MFVEEILLIGHIEKICFVILAGEHLSFLFVERIKNVVFFNIIENIIENKLMMISQPVISVKFFQL